MGSFILKRKYYSQYDETDSLKRMRDSDILAEKKRSTGWGGVGSGLAAGVAGGAALGGVAGAIGGAISNKGAGFKGMMKGGFSGLKKAGVAGAVVGGLALGAKALHERSKEKKENNFYNQRLGYAQMQAQRRERADWKNNMTQREGYSY